MQSSVVYAKSSERERRVYPDPARYRLVIDPPLFDVREISLRQAIVPRTDLRVADGTMHVLVDRVIKNDAVDVLMIGSLMVYTLSPMDSILHRYVYADIETPLIVHEIDATILGMAVDGYVSNQGDTAVFAFARAGGVYTKAYSPPSSLATRVVSLQTIALASASRRSVRIRPSFAPGRAYYAFLEGTNMRFGLASVYARAVGTSRIIAAGQSLSIALGASDGSSILDPSRLIDPTLSWKLRHLGTRTIGVVFLESVCAYVHLDDDETTIITKNDPRKTQNSYGNARFKLVDDSPYGSDVVYGGGSLNAARILDTSRRTLLLSEGGWLKIVHAIQVWDEDVAEVAPRKLLRFYANKQPISACIIKRKNDGLASTREVAAVVNAGSESDAFRLWRFQNPQQLPYYSEQDWPPICALSAINYRSLDMLLFASGKAWIVERLVMLNICGDALNAVLASKAIPGQRLLAVRTNNSLRAVGDRDRIWAFAEHTGQFIALKITPGHVHASVVVNVHPIGHHPDHANVDDGVLVPPRSKTFFVSDGRQTALLYASNYIYALEDVNGADAAPVVRVILTERTPFVYARQDTPREDTTPTTALYVDALGLYQNGMYRYQDGMHAHDMFNRIVADRGEDMLESTNVPYVAWSCPASCVSQSGDFFTLRSSDRTVYSQRTSGKKPNLRDVMPSAWWREGDTIAVAMPDGIYRVNMSSLATVVKSSRLSVLDATTGETRRVVAQVVPSNSEIIESYEGGILVRNSNGAMYLYDSTLSAAAPSTGGRILVAQSEPETDDEEDTSLPAQRGKNEHIMPYGPRSWLRAGLTHVAMYVDGATSFSNASPVSIENAVIQSVAYARVPIEFAPLGAKVDDDYVVCVGSTGSTSQLAIFNIGHDDAIARARTYNVVARVPVSLDGLLAGGFMAILVVNSQVAISFRNLTGGISTSTFPIPCTQQIFQQDIIAPPEGLRAERVSLATWSKFNLNLYCEAVLAFVRASPAQSTMANAKKSIMYYGDVTFDRTGVLALGKLRSLVDDVDDVDFLHCEPVRTTLALASFATVYRTVSATNGAKTVYVALNARDYAGWSSCASTQLVAVDVTVCSVTNLDGRTLRITALNANNALRIYELRATDSGFGALRTYPVASGDGIGNDLPSIVTDIVTSATLPSTTRSAHVVNVTSSNSAHIVFVDLVGARLARRLLDTFAPVPYVVNLRAFEGGVADTLADLLFAIDVNFFVSSGSSTDDTLTLNISHASVPFAIDLRQDPVLGAVLGWRDPDQLIIVARSVASTVRNPNVDTGALERIFSLADKNSDGQLTPEELLSIIKLPLTQIAPSIDQAVINEIESVLQSLVLTATFDALALSAIRILDPDESGTVSVAEFTRFVLAFVRNAHSVRSNGNIDEAGSRVIELYMAIDGMDAISNHTETQRRRPFTLLFLNVPRGERAIYQGNDYPAVVRFDPPKQTLSNIEFTFVNERIDRVYDFKGLENQLVFDVQHGKRSVASESIRAPDGTYTRLSALNARDTGPMQSMQRMRIDTLTRLPMSASSSAYSSDDDSLSPPASSIGIPGYRYDHGM